MNYIEHNIDYFSQMILSNLANDLNCWLQVFEWPTNQVADSQSLVSSASMLDKKQPNLHPLMAEVVNFLVGHNEWFVMAIPTKWIRRSISPYTRITSCTVKNGESYDLAIVLFGDTSKLGCFRSICCTGEKDTQQKVNKNCLVVCPNGLPACKFFKDNIDWIVGARFLGN